MDKIKTSKTISYILRHDPGSCGLLPDQYGYVPVADLLAALREKFPQCSDITLADIQEIIANSAKKRFEISGDKIRAVYDHSWDVQAKNPAVPPEILYHGTVYPAAEKILQQGILPMGRKYVHLSSDTATALNVAGRRRGRKVIFRIAALKAAESGISFYQSCDTTWQSGAIPPEFISVLEQ